MTVERWNSGRPDSPPVSRASAVSLRAGRVNVVFDTEMPSMPLAINRSTTGAKSSSAMSGAILTTIGTLRAEIEELKGSLVVLHCPAAVKKHVDVWGSSGDALPLMRRVKQQFDPSHVLNPHRFVGGI